LEISDLKLGLFAEISRLQSEFFFWLAMAGSIVVTGLVAGFVYGTRH
jgi:hypothetical protein